MRNLFYILSLVVSLGAKGQAPASFVTAFGGLNDDIGYGVKETYDRQYIVIGSTTSYGMGASDAYLALIDSMGQKVWQKTFGGLSSDVGKSILINPSDSGFIFTGYTNSYGSGGYDIYCVRTDKSGTLIWQSTFGGMDWDFGNDIIFSSDGDIMVCGSTFSSTHGNRDGIVIKLDGNSGNVVWSKIFGGQEEDEFVSIMQTSDGYYSIAGNTKSYGDLNGNFWLFKINLLGDSVTSKSLGNTTRAEKCYDLTEDNNNRIVFCGALDTSFYNTGKNVSFLMRTDLNGNYIDEKTLPNANINDDKLFSIVNISKDNRYFFSRKVGHGALGIDAQPYILDYNFIYIGTTTYGGFKEDETYDVILTKDNGYVMVGMTNSYSFSSDVYLIKLDSALLNSPVIIGIDEYNGKDKKTHGYYFNNEVYFENVNNELLNFQLFNSSGKLIQEGATKEDHIKITGDLANDIYIVRIIENGFLLKFIQN